KRRITQEALDIALVCLRRGEGTADIYQHTACGFGAVPARTITTTFPFTHGGDGGRRGGGSEFSSHAARSITPRTRCQTPDSTQGSTRGSSKNTTRMSNYVTLSRGQKP
ncbi:hypothetical protein BaRGS_00028852, partial [Batillaria attramentaria]